jgi:hypothetical protein
MFRQCTSVSLESEMTTIQGGNYPRSSGNIRYPISSSKVLETMLVINPVTNYMPPDPLNAECYYYAWVQGCKH